MVAVVPAIALLLAGCSADGGHYAVPRDICGVQMTRKAVEPLLPDGEKVRLLRAHRETGPQFRCTAKVDDKKAFVAEVWHKDERPEPHIGEEGPESSDHDKAIKNLPFSGWGAVSDDRVLSGVKCGKGRTNWFVFFLELRHQDGGSVKQRREAMVRFMKEFVHHEKKKEDCTAH
ncbi:hypothetical protein [Streptomyces sp. 891-h]|uniref:hypothetical protein n=1 Tax=Streptomyces sp. 891-h TaxID=2720714 RepID=UPI001FA9EA3F|nr:hypothetical protein [Streptomyces sp. 891-h]UNZ19594.1 hypothetical protein HC362_23720 [Streptomyces sp. 891-h]